MSVKITAANVDGREPVPDMTDNLWRTLYGDKGYIFGSFKRAFNEKLVSFITNTRKNMKPKNISKIEYSRHRSGIKSIINLIAGLITYTLQQKRWP
uniref:transposase n=1 Tax=Candidatus Enterovibrio escicola TaxID=1927127 RepID=UPI00374202C6